MVGPLACKLVAGLVVVGIVGAVVSPPAKTTQAQPKATHDPKVTAAPAEQKQPQSTPQPTCALKHVPYVYSEYICTGAKKYGADPAMVAAIVFYEHRRFEEDPLAYPWQGLCSHAGACGAGQFIASTWKSYGVDGDNLHPNDGGGDGKAIRGQFADDIHSAAHYIAGIEKKCGKGNPRCVGVEYNAGPAYYNVPDYRLPAETRDYIANVAPLWKNFTTQ